MISRRSLVQSSFSVALLFGTRAYASKFDSEVTFHIEPQSLESALLQFSRQADLQFAFASDLALNVPVRGLQGKLQVGAALGLLLQGSGLTYTVIGNNTVTVTRAPLGSSLNVYDTYPGSSSQRRNSSK